MCSTARVDRRIFLVALCGSSAAILTSCSRHSDGRAEAAEILIGEYGSLTGSTATIGLSTHNGIDMALDKANTSGGVLGKKIRVVVEDDRGKPEEAQTVVTRLITKYGVSAILGEATSTRSLAAAPIAQQSHIPMVTPSSTNLRVTQVGDYIFRTCFTDAFPSLRMARFVSNNLSLTKLAILRDIRNDYSVDLADVFTKDFQKVGGTIVADEGYGEGDIDFSAQLTKIKSRNPQAIFIPGYYTEVALIARQARQLGLTIPLLGSGSWDSPRLLEIGGEALEGSYYFNHFSAGDSRPVVQEFVGEYRRRFGQIPDVFAALGFDAAGVLIDAIRRANSTDPGKIRDSLAQTKDYPGVTGAITLDADRNAAKPVVFQRIVNRKIEFIETLEP
jgi:branched-chain amino acid transport system substrate-binding protein